MDEKGEKMHYKVDTAAFSGLLKWEYVNSLINDVRDSGSTWHYVYTQLENEKGTLDADKASDFIKARMEEIRELDEICGWFYVHTKENPSIIKIYHPRMSCGGCSITTPPPWVIIALERPETIADLESYKPIVKPKKKRMFKIFG